MIIIGVHKEGEFWENYEKAYFDVGFIASYDPARGIVILTLSKTEHHRQQQASDNKGLAKSEQRIEHLTENRTPSNRQNRITWGIGENRTPNRTAKPNDRRA